jgi:hypothetical protein
MRMCRSLARACNSAGMTVSRKCSNGTLSRKKNDSLVVIASTTDVDNGDVGAALSAFTRSARLARPALRTTGSRRLSTRYCFSDDSTRPERSRSILRM